MWYILKHNFVYFKQMKLSDIFMQYMHLSN